MSKRAEELANDLYPEKWEFNKKATGQYDTMLPRRKAYIQGYEQAEKDFAEILKERIKTYEGIYEENKAYDGDTESTAEVLKELKALLQDYEKDNTVSGGYSEMG